MTFSRVHFILLSLAGILFLILYFVLSINKKCSADDMALLSFVQQKGVLGAVADRYNNFCARWSADTLAFLMIIGCSNKFFLFTIRSFTLFALIFSFFLLLRIFFSTLFQAKMNNTTLLLYSLQLSACLFFISYDVDEVWFWYVSGFTYLWSIIMGNFLLRIFFSKKPNLFYFFLLLILAAYIAGAAESYAIIFILFLVILFILKRKNIFYPVTNQLQKKLLLSAIVFLSLFYLITIFAPGTWERKDMLTHAGFTAHFIMAIKAYLKIIFLLTPKVILYLFLFGIPWIFIGETFSSERKTELKKLFSFLLKNIFIAGIVILVLVFPASWILYDVPPARALSQVSFFISAIASYVFFCIGYKFYLPARISKAVATIALTGAVVILLCQIIKVF
ncbi:MAG: hypothetical protein HY063_15165 [Bacteroidetes bacterium]|nr:hypothetical protein [Bacteroidota bacterium]